MCDAARHRAFSSFEFRYLSCAPGTRVCAPMSARTRFAAHWPLKREPNLRCGDFPAAEGQSTYKDCTNEKCTCLTQGARFIWETSYVNRPPMHPGHNRAPTHIFPRSASRGAPFSVATENWKGRPREYDFALYVIDTD